jgi:hypothetical protein
VVKVFAQLLTGTVNIGAAGFCCAVQAMVRDHKLRKQPTEIVQKLSWQCSVDRVISGCHVNEQGIVSVR